MCEAGLQAGRDSAVTLAGAGHCHGAGVVNGHCLHGGRREQANIVTRPRCGGVRQSHANVAAFGHAGCYRIPRYHDVAAHARGLTTASMRVGVVAINGDEEMVLGGIRGGGRSEKCRADVDTYPAPGNREG